MNESRRIDMHVHIVGNGSSGSGCWFRLKGAQKLLAKYMLHHIGLPGDALTGDMDRLFVDRLLELVRSSSMDAVVLLAQDRVHDERGRVLEDKGTIYVPNQFVLDLARRHPEFLAAVSIHPARPDAIEELDRCIAGGAVMQKMLPNCDNVECSNPRYKKYWERLAEAGMPFLAHTGGENTMQVVRKALEDPRVLELPLQCGVTVIAAHCATRSSPGDTDYFPVLLDMMKKYPNLYGDISAMNLPLRGEHLRDCRKPPLVDRLVHGSDYPVPVSGLWAWMRGLIDWKTYRRCQKIDNVLERDYQIKRAMGFPPDVFTRIGGLLRKPGG